MNFPCRIERDFLGDMEIPAAAFWGIHAARAVDNFPISGIRLQSMPDFIQAFGFVKKAATRANLALGVIDEVRGGAILAACDELIAGLWQDQFVVDVIQGGAGTSTNMNANEVIANVALQKMGFDKGRYDQLHPNDHVNASQSTNDVYPTAMRVALWRCIERLLQSMAVLRQGFERKAQEFSEVLSIGRTQLQDAVPMSLGQGFLTYAIMLAEDEARLREARTLLQEINLGATAIGTGINAPPGYADLACAFLAEESGIPLVKAFNLMEATQDTGAFVQLSGVLKRVATKLSKTCNDLRLLSSGPQAGFGDISLPARQAGSSIMPGKVNPVIPEVVNQVAFEVIGNDVTITMASEAGQLQLNAFEPIIAWSLFKSIEHLNQACLTLQQRCVSGIQANRDMLKQRVSESITLVTSLGPLIGYEKAALLAKTAMSHSDFSIQEIAMNFGLLTDAEVALLRQSELLSKPFIGHSTP